MLFIIVWNISLIQINTGIVCMYALFESYQSCPVQDLELIIEWQSNHMILKSHGPLIVFADLLSDIPNYLTFLFYRNVRVDRVIAVT